MCRCLAFIHVSVRVSDPLQLELRMVVKLPWTCLDLNPGPAEEQPELANTELVNPELLLL